MEKINLRDNGGTRSGFERRHYPYYIHIPERRLAKERRSSEDRRNALEPRENKGRENYPVERRPALQPQNPSAMNKASNPPQKD